MSALATGRKIRTWTNRVKQFSSTLQHAVVEERGKLSRSSLLVHVVVGGHADSHPAFGINSDPRRTVVPVIPRG
jgi:hypothetical protein